MWQRFGILVGGYGFIVMSYAWVWVLSAGYSRHASADGMDRLNKTAVKAIVGMMVVWTAAWTVIAFVAAF